jgi:methyl-accepting chemotaxis protein WspA
MPLGARILNIFTFAQKFVAVCVLFALTIGSLAAIIVWKQYNALQILNIEIHGVQFHRPVMNLLQYVMEHQQIRQRYLLGDLSLKGSMAHLEARITDGLQALIDREHLLSEELVHVQSSFWKPSDDFSPEKIRGKWEELLRDEDQATVQQSYERHHAIVEQLRSLAIFIYDNTAIQPQNDIAAHYLMAILYVQIPRLQQWMLTLASVGETVAAANVSDDAQREALVANSALITWGEQQLQDISWKAISARSESTQDLSLQAAIEGPLSELDAGITDLVEYVKTSLLVGNTNQAVLGTYVITAARAQTEGFQFANATSEQLERMLIQQREAILLRAQLVTLAIGVLTFIAFFFSFVLFRAMFLPLKNLVVAAERLAKGDLSVRVPVLQSDEIAEVGRAFNHMAGAMEEILSQLQSAGVQLTTSTTQMGAAARQQEATIVQQETATKQIAVTAKEISLTATEFAGTIQEVTRSAEEASSMATSGQEALQQMKTIMQNMVESTAGIANQLAKLNDKTNTITGVITTITKVADRTNLLSLNAAIEAHKIGDKGGGFSVIATEIRRLADQTAVATLDIEKTVNEMVSAVSSGVEGMVKFSEDIRTGVAQATSISGILTKIIGQVQQQTSTFEIVNQGMDAQSVGAKQITESIEELSGVAQQSTSSIRQFHIALDQLSGATKDLQNTVSRLYYVPKE